MRRIAFAGLLALTLPLIGLTADPVGPNPSPAKLKAASSLNIKAGQPPLDFPVENPGKVPVLANDGSGGALMFRRLYSENPDVLLYSVFGSVPGTYRVDFVINSTDPTLPPVVDARVLITVEGVGPKPGPGPGPNPDVDPKPSVAPIPVAGLRVMIVSESGPSKVLSADRYAILYGAEVRRYLDKVCVKGPDGKTPEYRFWDPQTGMKGESKLWQDAMSRERPKVGGDWWILISNGTSGTEQPCPENIDEVIKLVKRFAPA